MFVRMAIFLPCLSINSSNTGLNLRPSVMLPRFLVLRNSIANSFLSELHHFATWPPILSTWTQSHRTGLQQPKSHLMTYNNPFSWILASCVTTTNTSLFFALISCLADLAMWCASLGTMRPPMKWWMPINPVWISLLWPRPLQPPSVQLRLALVVVVEMKYV